MEKINCTNFDIKCSSGDWVLSFNPCEILACVPVGIAYNMVV